MTATTSSAPARSQVTGPGRCAPIAGYLPPAWTDHALCAQVGGDVWFPEVGERTGPAKAICRRCPVRRPCLLFALATGQNHGIWGGLSTQERDKLRIGRAA